MSLRYRDSSGNETIVSGLTPGGDIEAGAVAEVRGTINIPQTAQDVEGYVVVTFPNSFEMPSDDYLVTFDEGDTTAYNFNISNKTTTGFRLAYRNTFPGTAGASSINYICTKTYTVQHAAQNAEDIANIKAVIPSTASSTNQLTPKKYVDDADTALNGRVSNLEDLIPTGASVTNQLATKAEIDNVYTKADVDAKLDNKQNTLTFDNTPTAGSSNPVKSNGIKSTIDDTATDIYKVMGKNGAKNLIPYPYLSTSSSMFTINSDGSVLVNGTAGSSASRFFFTPYRGYYLKAGSYILSDGRENHSSNIYLQVYDSLSPYTSRAATGVKDNVLFTLEEDTEVVIQLNVNANTTVTNDLFYPMLRFAGDADSTYQPYAMTNQQITPYVQNVSNPNFLDNPWFTVNQRGFNNASGGGTDSYRLDRWRGTYGYDTANNIPAFTGVQYAIQRFEPNVKDFLNGKLLTASVMYSDGTIESGTFTYYKQPSAWITVSNINKVYIQIGYNATASNVLNGSFCITNRNTDLSIKAVKVELGTISTLINDVPPNYQQELAKCQRYFVRIGGTTSGYPIALGRAHNATQGRYLIHLPVPMRSNAVVTCSDFTKVRELCDHQQISPTSFSAGAMDAGGYLALYTTTTGLVTDELCGLLLQGEYLDISADL